MSSNLRIALFADSFLEVDGAAMTCRRLVEYARQNSLPLICFHAGPETRTVTDGTVTLVSLKRSPLAISMDHDLAYDPLFQRHSGQVRSELERFRPNVLHITGLNDVSILAAFLGWRMRIPLLGSWHTNLHEFAAHRIRSLIGHVNGGLAENVASKAEKAIFAGAIQYYRMPKVILAPNRELLEKLQAGTGRTARLMGRGVDCNAFSLNHRTVNDAVFRFGFVGRLRPEKNVRLLVEIEKALINAGQTNFRFLIVGEGSERLYLEKYLKHAEFTGYIDGDELSTAYANMDAFIFPSETDTFGNVLQEAMASGVPAIVSDKGGPKFVISHGEDGYVAKDLSEFVDRSIDMLSNRERHEEMRVRARANAESRSWNAIFDGVYLAYAECVKDRSRLELASYEQADEPQPIGQKLTDVISELIRHPLRNIIFRWNWKSALLSALLRSPIFFTAYLAQKQGLWIAAGAMAVQFVFRTIFGGISGAMLQAFSKVSPAWHAVITIPLALAAVSHLFEFALQAGYDSLTGSKGKGGAVIVSVSISMISAVFNLFAMRRGVLLVRDESKQSLWRDLKQMPSIALEFLSFPLIWTWKKTRKA